MFQNLAKRPLYLDAAPLSNYAQGSQLTEIFGRAPATLAVAGLTTRRRTCCEAGNSLRENIK